MNKSILMSIQPQYVAKILNGEKTIEVRKKFPKDYIGWVYIYCTKGKGKHRDNQIAFNIETHKYFFNENLGSHNPNDIQWCGFNGKVVARFWCDKVEEIKVYDIFGVNAYRTEEMCVLDLVSKSRLTQADFERYLGNKNGYAIHISKLEVFDKPKELKEFRHTCKAEHRGYNRRQPCSKECKNCICNQIDDEGYSQCFSRLTKAPESWCYIYE